MHSTPPEDERLSQAPAADRLQRLVRIAAHFRLPALAVVYVLAYLAFDAAVDNPLRHYIFCILLVVSSLYFSWHLGGRETMLYVAFFNIFFAFIFSRLLVMTGGEILYRNLFLGRSFLVLYAVCLIIMFVFLKKTSPADLERRRRVEQVEHERDRRHRLELMVATQKLTQDTIQQANRVKDELLLLQGAWKSQVHAIVNDLPPVKEKELHEQIVAPFQESIISHLRGLESRLSFAPRPVSLEELHFLLTKRLAEDRVSRDGRVEVAVVESGWRGVRGEDTVIADEHKLWEIVVNCVRNSQTAMELHQIALMREDREAYRAFKPSLRLSFERAKASGGAGPAAVIRLADNGGGVPQDKLALLFKEPLPSAKRQEKAFGQGAIFVKFFCESMGMDVSAKNVEYPEGVGLEVRLAIPLARREDLVFLTGEATEAGEPDDGKARGWDGP